MPLVNFRDIGGLPLGSGDMFPTGRLYRSGTFDFLTSTEAAELASRFGIATVIDLRMPLEREHSHRPFLRRVQILQIPFLIEIDPEWEHPIDQSPDAVAGRYRDMLEREGRHALQSIISAITPDSLPLVIHCSGGKDRTGIVTALLLAIAGVTDEEIAADYARSGPVLKQLATEPATASFFRPDPPNEYDAAPETMRLFLDGVRQRYGSSEALAIASGVGVDDVQRARAVLLTPQ
ncbi:MAG: tyrosine-protein phosphatase [Acidimicrobiia bacterium]|nr:tyrosine-protein phosphatase [Acidimicrobiia bacterium]